MNVALIWLVWSPSTSFMWQSSLRNFHEIRDRMSVIDMIGFSVRQIYHAVLTIKPAGAARDAIVRDSDGSGSLWYPRLKVHLNFPRDAESRVGISPRPLPLFFTAFSSPPIEYSINISAVNRKSGGFVCSSSASSLFVTHRSLSR